MLKKIDKLLIISFAPPFIVTFFIALFVFIMSFLWTYIDEIVGKGADIFMLSELIFYLSVSLVPTSLPIAVLISSVMVMGNLSERYELTSIKSAGVPLLRTMRPLMYLAFGISIFSYICSDMLIPVANLQFKTRLYDIRRNKPTLNLEEGVFNYDFKGFVMYIGEKAEDGRSIKDVLIYDHNSYNNNTSPRILADDGEMYTTPDEAYFVMTLKNGTQYQEVAQTGKDKDKEESYPFMRIEFDEWSKVFDLDQFNINESDRRVYKSHHAMLSRRQLTMALDSLGIAIYNKKAATANISVKSFKALNEKLKMDYKEMPHTKRLNEELKKSYSSKDKKKEPTAATKKKANEKASATKNKKPAAKSKPKKTKPKQLKNKSPSKAKNKSKPRKVTDITKAKDSDKLKNIQKRNPKPKSATKPAEQVIEEPLESYASFLELFAEKDQQPLVAKAKSSAKNIGSQINASNKSLHRLKETEVKHIFELHSKYTLALACFIFLFIGAPMGAIIRKGGFGFPILIAIFFFVIFTVLNIFCKKVAESLVIDPIFLAWLPIIIIFPIGLFLTYRAMQDRKVVDFDLLTQKIVSIFKRGKKTSPDNS